MTTKIPQINFASENAKLEGASELRQEQFVPRPRDEVFEFFSEARNLERLTPPWLNFEIVEIPEQLSEGALIRYRLKLRGLPIHWTTRIEEWTPGERFVDTQIAGPYALWHHTHEFEDAEGGTLIRDIVRYRVPFGPLGEVVRRALVEPDTKKIFNYRREQIDAEFS
jgi:ligand-binding SRPBCC domain-containing protein